MDSLRARRSNAYVRGLSRLDGVLARRQERVRIAGLELSFDTLDDLDAVIDQLLASAPPHTSPAASVAEVCPHFGVLWPAALALAETVAESFRRDGAPASLLELGCGLGLPSMVARRLGVQRVVASDRHPLVPLFLARNAAANGIGGLEYRELDWRRTETLDAGSLGLFERVIGSDLLYESWQPGFLASALRRLLKPGGRAVVADPGRRYVDAFVTMLEAEGFTCELTAIKPTVYGKSRVDVLILEAHKV
jgi:predicted nicotinamide N-methyase